MRAAAAGLLLAGLAACGLGPGARIGEPVLPGDDIRRLVDGNSLEARTAGGGEIEVYYRADGTAFMRGRSPAGIPFQDAGRWSVENDRLCTRWRQVRGRQKTCEWVTYAGTDFRTFTPAGSLSAQGRLWQGPPAGIGRLPATPPTGGPGG